MALQPAQLHGDACGLPPVSYPGPLSIPNIYSAYSIPPLVLVIVFALGRLLIHDIR